MTSLYMINVCLHSHIQTATGLQKKVHITVGYLGVTFHVSWNWIVSITGKPESRTTNTGCVVIMIHSVSQHDVVVSPVSNRIAPFE